jgi:signal transduction histidine kinase
MAFLLLIVAWGFVLTVVIIQVFEQILQRQGLSGKVIDEVAGQFVMVSSVMTLVGMLIFFLIAHYFARAVTRPLQGLMSGVETLSKGDLSVRVPVDSQDEFGELAAAFNRMAFQLGELDRMKNEFVSTVSHELRTPLASVLGYSELLRDHEFSKEEQHEFLKILCHKADALTELVDGLLDLSRLDGGYGLELQSEFIDLHALVSHALDEYQRDESHHRFTLECPEGPITIFADRLRLARVIDNLLSNAVKYSLPGTSVHVALKPKVDHVSVSVKDVGKGMDEAQRQRVFDKFYRGDSSDTAIRGAGLGLSIAKKIIEAHGGTIWIESAVGAGTIVTFVLPRGTVRDERGT